MPRRSDWRLCAVAHAVSNRMPPTFDPREEPGALAAHAGICAGGEEQSSSLPRPFWPGAGRPFNALEESPATSGSRLRLRAPPFDPAVTARAPCPCGGSRPRRGRGAPALDTHRSLRATMRPFVLNDLKAKSLSVRDEDLADLRKERR